MRWLYLLLLLGGLCYPASGQPGVRPDTVRLSALTDRLSATGRALLAVTDWPTPLVVVQRGANWQPVRPGQLTSTQHAYWLYLWLDNDTDSARTLYGYIADNQTATAYIVAGPRQAGPRLLDSLRTGTLIPTHAWPVAHSDQYIPLRLLARQQVALYVRLANARGWLPALTGSPKPRPRLVLRLETETAHDRMTLGEYRKNSTELLYRSWIQGALLFIALFVGLIYAHYRQPIYGYYWLYVLAGCLFSLLKTRSYTPLGHWLSQAPLLRTYLPETIMWLGLGAYLFFFVDLLNLPLHHPVAARRLRLLGRAFAGFGLLYALVLLLTNDGGVQQAVFWGARYGLLPVYVGLLIWTARRVESPLVNYVLTGNGLMMIVGVLAWLRAGEVLLKDVTLPGGLDNLMTVSFAVLLEISVFALALARRIQLLDRERVAHQQAYIDEIEQRTTAEKRIAQVEMLALRSQMNPHFLFNSLNTIEYFVLKGDEANATRYLANFSRLLRLTLNHANENTVRLSEELQGLRLYVDLEATRFGDEFQYTIEADAGIDQEDVLLPPLLLQPFVENAIWHGLRQSPRPDKRLWIRLLVQDEHTLRFEIEDNGIGRRQAADLKSRPANARKSFGLAITQQRIDLFNRTYPARLAVQLLDIDTNGQTGTLIRMTYRLSPTPFIYESRSD
ncbi:MAG: histidine kinase [Bacteroidetes bacterium]|nr:histidine kinase [Fibrella sp.]